MVVGNRRARGCTMRWKDYLNERLEVSGYVNQDLPQTFWLRHQNLKFLFKKKDEIVFFGGGDLKM